MQGLAGATQIVFSRSNRNLLVHFGDRWQAENGPFVRIFGQVSGQIEQMYALHHYDNDARFLVVEPRSQGIGKPLGGSVSLGLGLGIDRLLRVVDNENVSAEP